MVLYLAIKFFNSSKSVII